jgi:hypothetical protein
MNRRIPPFFALIVLGALGILAAAKAGNTNAAPSRQHPRILSYHDHPPTEALPATLDPASFANNRAAFVSYTLAGRIERVLYQVPCYCPCARLEGHQSLLDCYTSKHGVACPTCQKEVIFCYLQSARGKKPEQIRKAIAKGKAWKLDLPALTESLYSEIQGGDK